MLGYAVNLAAGLQVLEKQGDGMAKQQSITASAVVEAPIEKVWELVSDSSRYAEWVDGTLEVLRTDGPTQLGATYDERTRISGPWKATTRWRVTEFDPPRRQVHDGQGVATAKDMSLLIELAPTGEQTEVTLTLRYTPAFGALGALIDRAVKGTVTRAQQRSAQSFASLIAREGSRD